jgi:sugar lactone lactonase YvrE
MTYTHFKIRVGLPLIQFIFFIHTLTFAQRVTTVAGGTGDGGPALSANLFGANDVTVDGEGNMYIADGESASVRKVDYLTGIITRIAGNGIWGHSGDGGLAINAALGRPFAVAIDLNGNILVADQEDHVIWKINASTGIITTIAGVGTSGFAGDNGPATSSKLNDPQAVIVGPNGNIYITDTGNVRIRMIDHTTGIITTVAGNGVASYSGDNGPATSASISYAGELAIDASGNIYIADYMNSRVRRVDSATGVITTVAGNGTAGFSGDGGLATQAMLSMPVGVLIDATGNLIISDSNNNRLRKVDLSTGKISTIVGTGVSGFNDGPALSVQLASPQGLAKDAAGNIFICEYTNRRIRKFNGNTVSTVVGNGGFGGDGGLATKASLRRPNGVAIDPTGNLFISDTENNRIRKIDKNTGNISTVAGDGKGQFSGDGGPAINARVFSPYGIIFDKDGNLFFVDHGNYRVRKIDKTSGLISTIAGNGFIGNSGDNGLATNASFKSPTNVAVDSLGNIFISDPYDSKIRRVDGKTGVITTFAGNGTNGSTGDGGLAINAQLSQPSAMTVDSKGNLLITDYGSAPDYRNSIRMVNPTTGIISTLVASTTTNQLYSPVGVIVRKDDLYILENYRIRKISLSTGTTTVIAGSSNSGYFGDGGSALDARFKYPSSFVLDQAGNLFLADTRNNCIRKIAARISQTVSFDALIPRTVGDAPFDLMATASSDLPVSFTSSNVSVATIGGKTVTILKPGTITITAVQSGNLDYSPASNSQPLVVNAITAIERSSELSSFQIYPNPVHEIVRVKLESENTEPLMFVIVNLLGEQILTENGMTNEGLPLNVSHLNPGVYLIKVLHGSNQYIEKFVKE